MIETRSITHIVRLFARELKWTDFFAPVMYCSYQGDKAAIPFFYSIDKSCSCCTDLTLPMDEILKTMKSNTRNEIRRAEKEGCEFAIDSDTSEFVTFYNAFCDSKGFPDYVSNARLSKFKNLLITRITRDDELLAMHATLLDSLGKIALLILSGSQRLDRGVDKKLIGWGNRYLHYKELEWLKSQGYETYDWSGVCLDENDPRYSIGQFKLSFGGKIVDSWTLKSPLYRLFEKAKNIIALVRKLLSK